MGDIAVVISARMSSSRLPGKALVEYIPGMPNLLQIVQRWRRHSYREPVVVVATSTDTSDDAIEAACSRIVPVYRGSLDNVLERMDGAIREHAPGARWVVRVLADNPLVDVPLVDWRIDMLERAQADGLWHGGHEAEITYAGTTDVWSRSAWDRIVQKSAGSQLEHPGAYYWDNLSEFSVIRQPLPMREYCSGVRTELDAEEDLRMFRALWQAAFEARHIDWPCIPTIDGLRLLLRHPEMRAINHLVPLKTTTKAIWSEPAWLCRTCRTRNGSVSRGNLDICCAGCGQPMRWYREPGLRLAPATIDGCR